VTQTKQQGLAIYQEWPDRRALESASLKATLAKEMHSNKYFVPYFMAYLFSSNYKMLVSVSYDSPFFRKYFTMIFTVSLVCTHNNGILLFTYTRPLVAL
jgi:hypothetical protein